MRRVFKHFNPSPVEDVQPKFLRAVHKEVLRKITDGTGSVIAEEKVRIPVVEEIPQEELQNLGLDSDLFSVETQLASGTNLFEQKPISTPLFGMTLDSRSNFMESLDNYDYDGLVNSSPSSEDEMDHN